VVPKPTQLGMPYEDVTLTTPDGVRIKGYVIPARRKPVGKEEWMGLSGVERKERGEKEMMDWVEEMGDDQAISVSLLGSLCGKGSLLIWLWDLQYAKSRPTVVVFHANAGNMGHRIPIARKFNVDLGCNVFMLSYRGSVTLLFIPF
jgi:hypothetical protein